MAEYKHGEMDITVQTKTFEGFIKFTVWCVVVIAFLCLFLAVFAS
ncbi:aa3-type cytochrome c oxidase subunit IV [Ruegeria arenilitoris]|nr:aa3-type cytochrome c oxidase subunit IV [Ruegeria arenilitoris]